MDLNTLENKIVVILKNNHIARIDDMALYATYVWDIVKDMGLGKGWLIEVFSNRRFRAENNIAPYGSVSRCRRKIQEKYPELRASEEQIKEKRELEKQYKAYALQKGEGKGNGK